LGSQHPLVMFDLGPAYQFLFADRCRPDQWPERTAGEETNRVAFSMYEPEGCIGVIANFEIAARWGACGDSVRNLQKRSISVSRLNSNSGFGARRQETAGILENCYSLNR